MLSIVFIAIMTIILDIIIRALPCPAIWRLHMAKRQKIALLLFLVAMKRSPSPSPLAYVCTPANTQSHLQLTHTNRHHRNRLCNHMRTLKAILKRFLPEILGSSIAKPTPYGCRNSAAAQLPGGKRAEKKRNVRGKNIFGGNITLSFAHLIFFPGTWVIVHT